MTTPSTKTTPMRIDMDVVHQISTDLDTVLRLAQQNFDMERAMAAYRRAYVGLRDMLHPTPIGQVDDAIVEYVDNLTYIPEEWRGLRDLVTARREMLAVSK